MGPDFVDRSVRYPCTLCIEQFRVNAGIEIQGRRIVAVGFNQFSEDIGGSGKPKIM
ncbi:MAG: hypothetical protein PVI13_05180 [Desulfobacterales bacterium]|jgi:hypothetical protein